MYSKPGEPTTLMHNKVIIRDEKSVCITTMDPTRQALSGSFNSFIYTTHKKLLEGFLTQFEELKSSSKKFKHTVECDLVK